jgi:hypothetical protein
MRWEGSSSSQSAGSLTLPIFLEEKGDRLLICGNPDHRIAKNQRSV